MALAVFNGAMGKDQPRPIHPLFMKEHNGTVPSGPAMNDLPAFPATSNVPQQSSYNALQKVQLPADATEGASGQVDSTVNTEEKFQHDISANLAPIFQRPTNNQTLNQALVRDPLSEGTLSVGETLEQAESLEEDPNVGRRKRQRKDDGEEPYSDHFRSSQYKLQGVVQSEDIPGSRNPEMLLHPLPQLSLQEHPSGEPLEDDVRPSTNFSATPKPSSSEREGRGLPQGLYPMKESMKTSAETSAVTPKKILKLNANGKLLSPSKLSELPGDGGRHRSRKATAVKKSSNKSKIVVMKYSTTTGSDIGKKIDEVMAGRKLPAASVPQEKTKQERSPKATHPFFLAKSQDTKPSREPVTVTPNGQAIGAKPHVDVDTTLVLSTGIRPVPSVAQPKTKTSNRTHETFAPMWPPRDFQHHGRMHLPVGEAAMSGPIRKSKQAESQIRDDESILNQLVTGLPDKSGSVRDRYNLRLPMRKLISGRECLHLIDQMQYGMRIPGTERHESHPAVKRLRSMVCETSPAFDQGRCENTSWCTKYAPTTAEDVLQSGYEVTFLRDWIKSLMVTAVDAGTAKPRPLSKSKATRKKKRARKSDDDLDDFVVSADEEIDELNEVEGSEDELSRIDASNLRRSAFRNLAASRHGSQDVPRNAIMLSGPHGCGKTAAVYAISKELGFEVFEINAGSRRSAKDVLDKVGDMTQNHLVQQHHSSGSEPVDEPGSVNQEEVQKEVASGRQATMGAFFIPTPYTVVPSKRGRPKKVSNAEAFITNDISRSRKTQKQSLILIEEVDVLFEEDKSFWSSITSLASQSKRPIILTCTDEALIPLGDLSLEAILRFNTPAQDLASEYLSTMAACEGHVIMRDSALSLYQAKGKDLRASIMELDFWCQMAVGSTKASLDWMLAKNEAAVSDKGELLKITSFDTFDKGINFLSLRPLPFPSQQNRQADEDLVMYAEGELGLAMTDWTPDFVTAVKRFATVNQGAPLARLTALADFADSNSDLDLICSGDHNGRRGLDATHPELSAKSRASYCEGYHLLEAFEPPNYTLGREKIAAAMIVSLNMELGRYLSHPTNFIMERQIESATATTLAIDRTIQQILEPLDSSPPIFPPPTGRLAPSLEGNISALTTDVAPYVRQIVMYDLRLEQQRDELSSALSSQEGGVASGAKRKGRTTRASRAALEGGRKEETRRERWFHKSLDARAILKTAGEGWQHALLEQMHGQDIADGLSDDIWRNGEPYSVVSESASPDALQVSQDIA